MSIDLKDYLPSSIQAFVAVVGFAALTWGFARGIVSVDAYLGLVGMAVGYHVATARADKESP